jgi:dihydrofolate synthase/folylpolyglutamate synthase
VTNIGLDHTSFRNTLDAIVLRKQELSNPMFPVIIGEYTSETKPVFLTKARRNSEIYFASDLITEDYPSDLIGDYQMHNKRQYYKPYRF